MTWRMTNVCFKNEYMVCAIGIGGGGTVAHGGWEILDKNKLLL